jgi:hypothetical protein
MFWVAKNTATQPTMLSPMIASTSNLGAFYKKPADPLRERQVILQPIHPVTTNHNPTDEATTPSLETPGRYGG